VTASAVPHRLVGRVAIVTGAGHGIGRAVAERLAAEGAAVVLAQRNEREGAAVAAVIRSTGGRALGLRADLSRPATAERIVERTVAEFGGLDILVNNAARVPERADFLDVRPEEWRNVMTVNLDGTFRLSQAAARVMADRGYGRIVNVLAIQMRLPLPSNAAYVASKGGGDALTRAMAVDLAPRGIVVNAVAPGMVRTEGWTGTLAGDPAPDTGSTALVGRMGRPEEVAALVTFLTSEECSFVVGQTIVCDGGRLLSRRGDPVAGE
jgi:NAD(P)-dependent dehydrogenase (short-subunit alcohol dehydrogenase family)